jgi:hypothetical protein
MITQKQREIILQGSLVQNRVADLLQAVKKKFGNLIHSSFLDVLINDMQKHVAEFIKVNGNVNSITEDTNRPLNEQQRRSLFHPSLRTEVDLRNTELHDSMLHERVISSQQSKAVTAQQTEFDGNELLLKILMRRSVADVKRFICFLHKTGQSEIAGCLTETGVIIHCRSTISSSTSSGNRILEEEKCVAEFSRQPDGQKKVHQVYKWWRQKAEKEFQREFPEMNFVLDIILWFIEPKNSLHWLVMCRNVQTLDNLRWLYFRGSYSKLLNAIFNRLRRCKNSEPLKLHVEWSSEDFEKCRSFFSFSHGQPFGRPSEWISGELPGTPSFKVSSTFFHH